MIGTETGDLWQGCISVFQQTIITKIILKTKSYVVHSALHKEISISKMKGLCQKKLNSGNTTATPG